jgi:hypothetical protein
VTADALYGHFDSGVWDLGPDACHKPTVLKNISTGEGRELSVKPASQPLRRFSPRMSILTRTGERAYHRKLLGLLGGVRVASFK